MANLEKQIEQFTAHAQSVLPLEDLAKKLKLNRPLRIKLGADPTAPDLHLGHAVVLSKMRQLQDAGHTIIFLIGDFTARIGDPTGKSKTRPALSPEQIATNTKTYLAQVGKILDLDKTEIAYNSTWLSKLDFADILKLCGKVTLARITQREDFAKRINEQTPVGMHELMYPVMQAYDSVALNADVEMGGTDQTFNLLMGRHIQEHYDQYPQVILTMPLLEGLGGGDKMSKSLGNAVGLHDKPEDAFGKLMSISDELVFQYRALLLLESENDLKTLKQNIIDETLHPMDLKKGTAFAIVEKFWSTKEAKIGQANFEALFQKKDYGEAPETDVSGTTSPCWIVDLLKAANSVQSTSDAKRLIESNSVHLNDALITDFKAEVTWKSGDILKVGKKRIYKLSS